MGTSRFINEHDPVGPHRRESSYQLPLERDLSAIARDRCWKFLRGCVDPLRAAGGTQPQQLRGTSSGLQVGSDIRRRQGAAQLSMRKGTAQADRQKRGKAAVNSPDHHAFH
jgi:hypothetical protein